MASILCRAKIDSRSIGLVCLVPFYHQLRRKVKEEEELENKKGDEEAVINLKQDQFFYHWFFPSSLSLGRSLLCGLYVYGLESIAFISSGSSRRRASLSLQFQLLLLDQKSDHPLFAYFRLDSSLVAWLFIQRNLWSLARLKEKLNDDAFAFTIFQFLSEGKFTRT